MAGYRKEDCGSLLCLSEEDLPDTTPPDEARQRHEEGLPAFPFGSIQAKHRRIRRWDVLWAVKKWSEQWRVLEERIRVRKEAYARGLQEAEEAGELEVSFRLQECQEACEKGEVKDGQALDDLDAKFKLYSALLPEAAKDAGKQPQFKRANRKSRYVQFTKAGLQHVAKSIGLTPRMYGENLSELDAGYAYVRSNHACDVHPCVARTYLHKRQGR